MYVHNVPIRLTRSLAPRRLAGGALVTLALLSAACSNSDPASSISAPSLLSSSSNSQSAASSGPSLGTASNFTVLGGAGVTCTESTITGAVGSLLTVLPTPTCNIHGAIHQGDAAAVQAWADAFTGSTSTYEVLKAMACPTANILPVQLGGQSLAPGVYCSGTLVTELLTTGNLTLTGSGPWVFQIGRDITTDAFSVVMAGGDPCNVFWEVGTLATIGNGTAFQGNILAGSAITFTGANSSLVGRALAKTAVTATGATITGCKGGKGKDKDKDKDKDKCNQGVGNGSEGCDPGNSNHRHGSNDEDGGTPGHPGRKGGD